MSSSCTDDEAGAARLGARHELLLAVNVLVAEHGARATAP
jgi:hypothetical protein